MVLHLFYVLFLKSMIVHLSAFLYTSVSELLKKEGETRCQKSTLKNVSKIYENQQYAVRNVNLEIQDKEFVILVGPSGCGNLQLFA